MVTAETAAVLPLLAAVTLAMVWLVSIGVAEVRVTDAAREAARAAARGESVAVATELAQRAAPGAEVAIVDDSGRIAVEVVDQVEAFGLFGGLGRVTVSGDAVALAESG